MAREKGGALGRARRYLGLAAVGVAVFLAVGLHLLRRRKGYSEPPAWLSWHPEGPSRWVRALFPPISAAELGEGARAFSILLLLVLLGLLPFASRFGVDLPITFRPWGASTALVSTAGYLLYAAARVWIELRGESAG